MVFHYYILVAFSFIHTCMSFQCAMCPWTAISDIVEELKNITLAKALGNVQDPVTRKLCTLKTDELIAHYGYIPEVHKVTTDDGYILTVFRCNSKKPFSGKKKVVVLQHGLFCSSDEFCVNVPNQALAYVMADAGYDVWIRNNRGNFYSRQHISKDPNDKDSGFWDFSWDDIALHDYPAVYDYIRAHTDNSKLYVIGHSQGTTATMALLSEKPEYNNYLHAVSYLAPVGYLNHLRLPKQILDLFPAPFELMHKSEFMPRSAKSNNVFASYCSNDNLKVCNKILNSAFGPSNHQRNDTMLPSFLCHFPSGSAYDQVLHYMKQYQHGFFGRKMTGSKVPKDFDLSRITVPTSLHYSPVDPFTNTKDVAQLITKLKNTRELYVQRVDQSDFGHMDFTWGIHSANLIYSQILKFFAKHQ